MATRKKKGRKGARVMLDDGPGPHTARKKKATKKKKKAAPKMPDFMARLKEDYGDHVSPDSQPIFDELREDRF